MRWLKKTYPWIKWVVSFADGTQCGDGTIYRASGFVLTGIKENTDMHRLPDGSVLSQMSLSAHYKTKQGGATSAGTSRGASGGSKIMKHIGGQKLPGFQLRYIYFIDPSARERLTVPVLPFSAIDERGARMYKGKSISRAVSIASDAPAFQVGEGGSTPTTALHSDLGGA